MHFHRLCLKKYYCRGTCSTAFNQLCHYRRYAIYNIQSWILLCFRYKLYLIIIFILFYFVNSHIKVILQGFPFLSGPVKPYHKSILVMIKILLYRVNLILIEYYREKIMQYNFLILEIL
jgi:hypothetical protein